jgi:hypothetical protein
MKYPLLQLSLLAGISLSLFHGKVHAQSSGEKLLKNEAFTVKAEKYGLADLQKTHDIYSTNYIRSGRLLGDVVVRFRQEERQDSAKTSLNGKTTFLQGGKVISTWSADAQPNQSPLQLSQSFELKNDALLWKIRVSNTTSKPLSIEDLALPLFYNNQGGENAKEIFEQRVIKHHFVSGNNSFIFWQRPTGMGPYLVMVPLPGTSLEYFAVASSGEARGAFNAFIHSSFSGNKEDRGTWRQPHTSAILAANTGKSYGFKFRWARDYEGIRNILIEEGLIDVQVTPGMTVPNDLETTLALRTHQKISKIIPEFQDKTLVTYLGEKQKGTHLYKIKFARLGENKLTVHYGNGYKTYLEFFVTEPLEVLYKKRASFIVNSQQHRDASKWYDGLFSVWDMKNKVLRGPDNDDGFNASRLTYVLTCDDPILCKAPFIASKNVYYPDQKEIDAVEYYIEHHVWGKLQRTDKETPYPYGVYGTPNWLVNRDTARRRKNTNDRNQDKLHVWRSYDYPHMVMLYYHMYQVASLYPDMTRYLDKKGYLERAKETAKAYFKYPYEILPWYETYKWGCYNELLIVDLIAELEKEGYKEDAAFLRSEWEKKAKYFIYDDPYPFRSEYAIDATAYESTYALAKYALQNTMQPDSNLWYDKNFKRWYSHPQARKEDAALFMERQLQANIACRGWLEPAYYFLGSDFRGRSDSYTLSYMSQMGGWSILDYALHFSKDPAAYIQLGYASYLSSFALMNTGTPETGYGFWFPGKENDGASGWAFEPQKYARTWIQKPQGRGPWYYDGEIDLGYGGALRMASTIVTDHPVFGTVTFGGQLSLKSNRFHVIPKDGLRRRFYYRDKHQQIDIELNRDGFSKDQPIVFDHSAQTIEFQIENRSADAHELVVQLKGLNGTYEISVANKRLNQLTVKGELFTVKVPIETNKSTTITIRKK